MYKFLLVLFLTSFALASSIDVSGTIATDSVWEADTVFVKGDILIENGVHLSINPGTTIIAEGFYKIDVQGSVQAVGTSVDSIKFTASNTTEGWNRILFSGTPVSNDSSLFDYCIIEYGKPFTNSNNPDGGAFYITGFSKLSIRHSDIRLNHGSNAAIIIDNSSVLIENCSIHDNNNYGMLIGGSGSLPGIYNNKIFDNSGSGVYTGYSNQADFVNNLIFNNSGYGIYSYQSNSRFINNTIVENQDGGINFRMNSVNDLYNNIIYGNVGTQVQLETTCDPNFYNCNIQGGTENFNGDGAGVEYTGAYSNCLDNDPLFMNSEDDPYALQELSPCRDRGYNGIYDASLPALDLSGKQRLSNRLIDIGAYEYYIKTDIVSGVWSKENSPYLIDGNLFIEDGSTLTIEPGVEIIFQGFFQIDVQGTLIAEGTESDSIKFTAANQQEGWSRIVFINTPANNDTSVFSYCIVEYGNPWRNLDNSNKDGGAFYITGFSKLSIRHSDIRYNHGVNTAVYMDNSSPVIENCGIHDNFSYGMLIGGSDSQPKIFNNKIFNNSSAGVYTGYSNQADFVNNLIFNNSGYGIYSYQSNSRFINNTIVGNQNGGINFRANSVNDLYNNIIYGNAGTQVQLETTCDPDFYYCDIEDDSSGFSGDGAGTEYSGIYSNCLDVNPEFADSLLYNLSEGSGCIDAGTPDTTGLNLYPLAINGVDRVYGNRIDIGASEFGIPTAIQDDGFMIADFKLNQNYPNPFNPETTIKYSISRPGHVNVIVYNILGQTVARLVDRNQATGSYQVKFDGSNLSSGLYFYRLSVDNRESSIRKMMLIK
ncbi:MAG: right-handed parallel beta-helix repeat-containing protein [Calditrichaceae bacterium]